MIKLHRRRKKGFSQTCLRAFGRQGRGKRKGAKLGAEGAKKFSYFKKRFKAGPQCFLFGLSKGRKAME